MIYNNIQIITGNANPALARGICEYLQRPLSDGVCEKFPDTETNIKLNSDVRGSDVFIVQPTCAPVNEHLMELLLFCDTLRRSSAGRITTVVPYFGYARKDRKDEGRVPISAKLVANLMTKAGADRVVTIDLHAQQIQGFFDIPVDHLYGSKVQFSYYRQLNLPDLVVVSPDVGGMKMARAYSSALHALLAVVDKRRLSPDSAEVGFLIGDVEDKNVLLVDDLIATAGTLVEAAKLLKDKGALDIYVAATHPILCGPAIDRLTDAPIKQITVTDTVPLSQQAKEMGKIKVLSVVPLLGEAIRRIHKDESVSSLFIDTGEYQAV
ncbi:MAG: ribose-phosphate pyrophosphokinase [Planctomycetota bacterium]|jgi:ribose-phosphate pyrophosphokinase|nr:ribose-phosphate pyrophosphokinase [Planctomycetota bacterium]MDP7130673.1 ribose-phosphate pyrophosphokinase [Planctomycetota bacterium]MDP7249525.1 ribose-phosphate pyrophosphokinase [Planctomycetota bacterium]